MVQNNENILSVQVLNVEVVIPSLVLNHFHSFSLECELNPRAIIIIIIIIIKGYPYFQFISTVRHIDVGLGYKWGKHVYKRLS